VKAGVASQAKKAAFAGILRRLKEGKKLTAAELDLLDEMESRERSGAATTAALPEAGVATLDDDLEEWTLRDGVVRGQARRLSSLAVVHQVNRKEVDRKLWKIQRALLSQYGFESGTRSGPLTGNEALALQWVKSIAQLARASQEWELQMLDLERARANGGGLQIDRFAALVGTLKQLADKRDSLALKVRELSMKEKKAGTGRGQKANNFQIVIRDDELA
jgi:hypothetical protein